MVTGIEIMKVDVQIKYLHLPVDAFMLNNRGSQNRALGDTMKKSDKYTLLAKVLDTLDWMYFSYDLKSPFDLKVDVEMLESSWGGQVSKYDKTN